MQRENFRSRLGLPVGQCRLRHRHRQCLALPLYHRPVRRRILCAVLSHLSGHHGHPRYDDGAGRGPRQPQKRRTGLPDPRKAGPAKWHIHGWFCLLGCCLLMMYYTTVTGWMVDYFYKFLRGDFVAGMGTEEIGGVFSQMLSSRRNDHLYGHRGRSGLFGLQLWRAERPRAHHQGHDDRPAGPHCCAGGAQPAAARRR